MLDRNLDAKGGGEESTFTLDQAQLYRSYTHFQNKFEKVNPIRNESSVKSNLGEIIELLIVETNKWAKMLTSDSMQK